MTVLEDKVRVSRPPLLPPLLILTVIMVFLMSD
jgi:hypothetical protein